jgi:flagellar FliJ protein
MKGFRFRLERILRLRTQEEQARAAELGAARREEQAQRDRLDRAQQRLGRIGEQLAAGVSNVVAAGALHNLGLTVSAAADEIERASESHSEAELRLQTEEDRFGAARRDRRVVERLRERRKEGWLTESSRQEQREMDDLGHRGPEGSERV